MGIICNLGAVLTRGTRLRGDPACSFWVMRMKGCREISLPAVERRDPLFPGRSGPALLLLPVGWIVYFTNQTSGRVWGSHALIISLDVLFVCIKSHFASLHLSSPPLATPTRLGITSLTSPSAGSYRILPASQCIFTPGITCPTRNRPQLFSSVIISLRV